MYEFPTYLKTITDTAPRAARKATDRHIAGQIGYGEWISELRSLGLSVAHGGTKLTIEQQRERNANLTRMYPVIRKLMPLVAAVAEAGE